MAFFRSFLGSQQPAKPEVPTSAYNYNDNKVIDGYQWRIADLSSDPIAEDLPSAFVKYDNLFGNKRYSGVINFNNLSENSLGTFSGKATGDTYVFEDKVQGDGLYYHFTNQPYSTYGILQANDGSVRVFDIFVRPKITESTGNVYGVELYRSVNFEDKLKGDVNYHGGVIAAISGYDTKDYQTIVKDDGTVDIKAYINSNNANKAMVNGTINSDTLGEIKLLNTEIKYSMARGKASYKDIAGNYYVSFAGNDFNEVVGDVNLVPEDKESSPTINLKGMDKLRSYEAVFGGVKQ